MGAIRDRVVLSRGKWSLAMREGEGRPDYYVVSDGWFVDYPLMYDNGHVVYDFPERIPAGFRQRVARYLQTHGAANHDLPASAWGMSRRRRQHSSTRPAWTGRPR